MPQPKGSNYDINYIDSGFVSSCWTSIVRLHHVQTIKEMRREQISKASTPVPGNINYVQKASYMGCWSVKVRSASRSVRTQQEME